nr:hypothetical protein CFP56_77714 [Quercus suber]
MSRRARSGRDCGKASAVAPSQANSSSSNDDTVSASVQVVQTLKKCFDRGDRGPSGEELDDELMFDVGVDLEADDRVESGAGAPRRHSR